MLLTSSSDEADDLVQSAVERTLNRLDQWQPGTRLDRWVFQIVKTVWLNGRRSSTLRRAENIDDHTEAYSVDGRSLVEAKLTLSEVRAAFDALPDEQRQALFLVCVEGYTYVEAADLLAIPLGTVISRLTRGRAALVARQNPVESNIELIGQRARRQ